MLALYLHQAIILGNIWKLKQLSLFRIRTSSILNHINAMYLVNYSSFPFNV